MRGRGKAADTLPPCGRGEAHPPRRRASQSVGRDGVISGTMLLRLVLWCWMWWIAIGMGDIVAALIFVAVFGPMVKHVTELEESE